MEHKNSSKHAHKPTTRSTKQLILVLSVSATLGFWAIFSNKDKPDLTPGENDDQATGDMPPTQAANQFVLELPPVPTLIPELDSSRPGLELPTIPSQNLVSLPQLAAPLTGKIFLGGAKPQSRVVMAPAPVTRTRSSK